MWLSTAENHEKLILCHKYPLLFAISKALMVIPAQNGMQLKKMSWLLICHASW